jgi:hypothetical protein
MESGYAKDARDETPRGSRLHFHPPGVALWQAPFVATKAINTNPI